MEEEKTGKEIEQAETAFLVVVPSDGKPSFIITKDVLKESKREATIVDVRRALHEIESYLQMQGCGQAVLGILSSAQQQPKSNIITPSHLK